MGQAVPDWHQLVATRGIQVFPAEKLCEEGKQLGPSENSIGTKHSRSVPSDLVPSGCRGRVWWEVAVLPGGEFVQGETEAEWDKKFNWHQTMTRVGTIWLPEGRGGSAPWGEIVQAREARTTLSKNLGTWACSDMSCVTLGLG